MSQERKLPPDQEVVKLHQSGMSYAAIATMFGVHKSAVGFAVDRAGHAPGNETSGYMPPGLRVEHWHAPAAKNLRALARRQKGRRPLREADAKRLDSWLAMLRENDFVVAYAPDIPPNPASPSYGGWMYVKRPAGVSQDNITVYETV